MRALLMAALLTMGACGRRCQPHQVDFYETCRDVCPHGYEAIVWLGGPRLEGATTNPWEVIVRDEIHCERMP
jgi:hypothetical protein